MNRDARDANLPDRPTAVPTGAAGFSLVELLIVMLLTAIVLAAIYQVLITNQRIYTAQAEQVAEHGTVRAGLGILSGEFREISSRGGDILEMEPTLVEVRTMRSLGFVCLVDLANPMLPRFHLRLIVGRWELNQPVFIFADNDPSRVDDDRWLLGRITQASTSEPCPGEPTGTPRRVRIEVIDLNMLDGSSLVHLGAPVRSVQTFRYGLMDFEGQPYLGRQYYNHDPSDLGWQEWTPLVGPLAPDDGLRLEYFDANGNATNDPGQVQRIDVHLRTLSEARDLTGEQVAQSITTSVYTRN